MATFDVFNYYSINEAYFGSNKKLDEALMHLSKFREAYMDRYLAISRCNTHPELLSFNRCMEEIFGFKTFCLNIEQAMMENAYTYSLDIRSNFLYNTTKDVITDRNGFRYKKEAGYNCFVFLYSRLIFDSDFTDREIMGIILHEIGHNFSQNIDNKILFTSEYAKLLYIPSVIINIIVAIINTLGGDFTVIPNTIKNIALTNKYTDNLYIKCMEKLNKSNIYLTMKDILGSIFSIKDYIQYNYFYLKLPLAVLNIPYIIKNMIKRINIISLILSLSDYSNEKIADNFATMYGYGSDLSNALLTMEEKEMGIDSAAIVKNIPIIGCIYDITTLPVLFIIGITDPHPNTAARVNNQAKYIRAELKKQDIDPKMKKELEYTLSELENIIDKEYKKIDTSIFNSAIVRDTYNKILYDLFGGDIKELPAKLSNNTDEYNIKIDKAVKKFEII